MVIFNFEKLQKIINKSKLSVVTLVFMPLVFNGGLIFAQGLLLYTRLPLAVSSGHLFHRL